MLVAGESGGNARDSRLQTPPCDFISLLRITLRITQHLFVALRRKLFHGTNRHSLHIPDLIASLPPSFSHFFRHLHYAPWLYYKEGMLFRTFSNAFTTRRGYTAKKRML
jgi:hypothetical protein